MTTDYQLPSQTPPVPPPPQLPSDRRDRFMDDPRKKSVMLAVLLSAMPGLGHVYVGYYREAFRNIAVVCGIAVMLSTNALRHGLEAPAVLFLVFFLLFNFVDAGRRASLYNQALAGLRPMDLPEDMQPAQNRGSLVGGILLVVVGLMFFLNTMFDVPLYWLQQWWPMGFVAGGAWLIYADWQARQAEQAKRSPGAASAPPDFQ